jgi:tetratricopeptide (TPR) repeat protein
MRRSVFALGAMLALTGAACSGGSAGAPSKTPASIASLREAADGSRDAEAVGKWMLVESFAPGGTTAGAGRARKQLAASTEHGLWASLARAVDAELHGSPQTAADAYVATLVAARPSQDRLASLAAWYAVHHLLGLRSAVNDLYLRHRKELDPLVREPGHLGFRAAAELVEWSIAETFDRAEATGDAYDALVKERSGCASNVALAGPFGHGSELDRRRAFDAEKPGPWPPAWAPDPLRGTTPHVLHAEQPRCLASSSEHVEGGVFYAQSFFTTAKDRDALLAVSGAAKVWVDDVPVLERSLDDWGTWQRFGVAVHVGAGRHRVLARLINDSATVRILNLDGSPAAVTTDGEQRAPYALTPPTVLDDPNPIDALVHAVAGGATPAPASLTADGAIEAWLASHAAHADGLNDVAALLIDPLVAPDNAAGPALEQAAFYADHDPALSGEVRARTQKDLYGRALKADPGLWYSQGWLVLDAGEKKGIVEAVEPLRQLVARFPEEPDLLEQLARAYARLNWQGERMRALAELAGRFPDDVGALRLDLEALDQQGPIAEADRVASRIKKLDPDSEVDLDRAIAREDWKAAAAELDRIRKRRPDRKDIAARLADVLARAGDPSAAVKQLEKALAKDPLDSSARFSLADMQLGAGHAGALRKALADALAEGAKTNELRAAIDLLEGATHLEPWRLDGKKQIKDFEAWEKKGKHMDGTAARVLDYSALWIHPDGSSDMLEHEILRIQAQEEIGRESEQAPPTGIVLHLRVIKPDGRELEPEPVEGKPTLTMPHLEVGDYIEIEHITPEPGDGSRGLRYRGPTWFFREADKGYWRSEFVVIAPKDKKLQVETRGTVPTPVERDVGPLFRERRWLAEDAPPEPEEPESAPPQEYFPSVRLGWGVTLDDTVARFVDLAQDTSPLDPRLRAKAKEIVAGIPEGQRDERARAVYDWVLDHVEDGPEKDGRKVVFARSGSRQSAFLHLMRQLGIPIDLAIVKDRLASPATGPMSDVDDYDSIALRLDTGHGKRWLTVHDKFAPYGYVPTQQRGQECILLVPGTPRDRVTSTGATDGLAFEGRADLREDGSASVDLSQSFSGTLGIQIRNVIDKIPEGQLHDFVETKLIGRNLPGARVRDLKFENAKDLSAPFVLRTRLEVPQLARQQGAEMVVTALFPVHLTHLATLPQRQTPLFMPSWAHVEVKFEVVVPQSMKMPASLPQGEVRDGERVVQVNDTVSGHALELVRLVDVPAGRVQPAEYPAFLKFTQGADALVEREIALGK